MNDETETDGAAPELLAALEDVVAAGLALLDELEDDDDDELPHAAIASALDTAQAATTGLLLSKCTKTLSSLEQRPSRTMARLRDERRNDQD